MPLSEDCDVFWEPSLKSSSNSFGLIDRRLSEGMDQGVCDLGASCSFVDLSKKWMRSISRSFGSHLKLFLSERIVRGGIWEVRKECPKRFLGGKKSTCYSLVRERRLHVHCCCRLDVVQGQKKGSTPPLCSEGSPLCLPLLVFTW